MTDNMLTRRLFLGAAGATPLFPDRSSDSIWNHAKPPHVLLAFILAALVFSTVGQANNAAAQPQPIVKNSSKPDRWHVWTNQTHKKPSDGQLEKIVLHVRPTNRVEDLTARIWLYEAVGDNEDPPKYHLQLVERYMDVKLVPLDQKRANKLGNLIVKVDGERLVGNSNNSFDRTFLITATRRPGGGQWEKRMVRITTFRQEKEETNASVLQIPVRGQPCESYPDDMMLEEEYYDGEYDYDEYEDPPYDDEWDYEYDEE